MPLFTASSPFDADVERATSELNAADDMALIKEICDKVKQLPSSAGDCLRSIVKRMNHKVPLVAMQALTLLDACVRNCGYAFQVEMATRDFVSECRTFITSGKPHQKVVQKLKMLIRRWAENEFCTDSSLSLIPSMYNSLSKIEGHNFPSLSDDLQNKEPNSNLTHKEEDDIAKAIEMSLKEAEKYSTAKSQSLYPAMNVGSGTGGSSMNKELRKVRTLYDFEAAEDNELTFKAGEIINILDDSDPNWWKGSSWRGEGLFPANFVSADLTAEPEPDISRSRKSVHFQEEVDVKILEPTEPEIIEIDEGKIDRALAMIQNADPTGEFNQDQPELLALEDQCKAMCPLIDQELEKVDRQHIKLMEYNSQLMNAFKMYNNLMSELPTYGYVAPNAKPSAHTQQMFTSAQFVQNQTDNQSSIVHHHHQQQQQTNAYGLVQNVSTVAGHPNVYQSYGNEMSLSQTPSFPPPPPPLSYNQYAPMNSNSCVGGGLEQDTMRPQQGVQQQSFNLSSVVNEGHPQQGFIQMPLTPHLL